MLLALDARHGFEQRGAKGRCERQGHESRKRNGRHQHHRKLPVDVANRASKEGQWRKHRHQHQAGANHGPRDLLHGFAGRFPGWQPLVVHQAVHVFDHHNRVVHHDADDQHHAKHGQHVDRESECQQNPERTQQGNRHHDGRDEGVAPVLQKQEHDQEHQRHRLHQGDYHLLDRQLHEVRAVVGDGPAHAGREKRFQLLQGLAHRLSGSQGVAVRRQLHADAGGRLAIDPCAGGVELGAPFHPGHVTQPNRSAAAGSAQHQFAKGFRRGQLALYHHGGRQSLAGYGGQSANLPGRNQGVLGPYGRHHFGATQSVGLQLHRVDPDPHGPFGPEQLGLTHAVDALQRGNDVAGGVVAQDFDSRVRIAGGEDGKEQEVGSRFIHPYPLLRYCGRQAWGRTGQAVLHIHLSHANVGADFEPQRHRARAIRLCDGLHVDQSGRAVHLAFDDGEHAFFQGAGRCARVVGRDHQRGWGHRRVLGNRQLRDGDDAEHHHEQRDHPGKDGAVDKKMGHGPSFSVCCSAASRARLGLERCQTASESHRP